MKRSAMIGLAVLVLMASVSTAAPAERAVLSELFGSTWCGYCPRARAALQGMQGDYGAESLVVLYYHVNDAYATAETQARATYYGVGGVPENNWDSVTEVIGAPDTVRLVYEPIYAARKADSTPVVIRTKGLVKDDPDTSWIEATFKAVEPVTCGALRAQFMVYENIGTLWPWTVRDVLPTESVTLSAVGDSVTVRREFVVSSSWNHANVWIATLIEKVDAPKLIVAAQDMRAPYGVEMSPLDYAEEIPYFGAARFYVDVKNTGAMPDSITIDIASDFPGSVGPYEWIAIYCDPDNTCWMGPQTYHFNAGEVKRFSVEIYDYIGTVSGLGLATVSATSKGDPAEATDATFAAFVNSPSILIVDDDAGAAYQTHLEQAVLDNGYTPLVWNASVKGRPPQLLLDDFWSVLWTTANTTGASITAADEARMAAYLDGGGNLLLSSMGYLSSRAGATPFTEDYLHITSWTNDTGGFTVTGVAGDPISDGMSLGLLSGPFPPSGSDSVVLESPADGIFSAAGVGLKALAAAENDHHVVFLSFPFEDVKTTEADPNNQATLLYRILHWFGPIPTGVEGEGPQLVRLSLGQNFPNPFNPMTTVAFTVPADAGRVTLTVHNVNGRVVRTLVDGELEAGPHSVLWERTDESGRSLASGVYFARLSAAGRTRTVKMALLK